jgi:hypothetical protein
MTALFFPRLAVLGPETNWVNPPLLVEVSVPSQEQVVMYRYMWINVIGFTFCSTISLSSLPLITCLECPNLSYVAVRLHLSSVSICCLYRTMKNCTYYYVSLLTAFCNFCLSLVGVFIYFYFFFLFCFWRLLNLLLQTSPLSKTVPGARYSRNA